LKGQSFVSIGQKDDAAILETMFLQDVLQDMIVPMSVGTQVGDLLVAPLQAGVCHAFAGFCACQSMNHSIRRNVIRPLAFVNMCISGVVALDKGKSSDNLSGFVDAHVAVSLFNVS